MSESEPSASASTTPSYSSPFESDDEDEDGNVDETVAQKTQKQQHLRRLSTFGDADEILADLEDNRVDNTVRGQ